MKHFFKKYKQYLTYLFKHKWYVLIECWKVGLYWRGIVHNLSKFRPSELIPYANYFYNLSLGEYNGFYNPGNNEKFDIAWLKHIHRNPHHWQHWLLQQNDGEQKAIEMPYNYMKEMLCDWNGAGKAQGKGNNTKEWYLENRRKMILHQTTRGWLDKKIIHNI